MLILALAARAGAETRLRVAEGGLMAEDPSPGTAGALLSCKQGARSGGRENRL